MGTHPIFESDFDCLTETKELYDPDILMKKYQERVRNANQIMKFVYKSGKRKNYHGYISQPFRKITLIEEHRKKQPRVGMPPKLMTIAHPDSTSKVQDVQTHWLPFILK